MPVRVGLLLLALVASWPCGAAAQPRLGVNLYTLEGIVAPDRTVARQTGWFAISVGIVGDRAPARWVGVTSFLNWRQDPFVGRETIRLLMPADPTLLLTGPPDLVARFQTAPPGARLAARGMLDFRSRVFMVSAVTVTTPESP